MKLGLKAENKPEGLLITETEMHGPAAEAGLVAGDLIISIDGQRCGKGYENPIFQSERRASLVVLRAGERLEVHLGEAANFDRDRDQWLRQVAADDGLSKEAHQLASVLAEKYLHAAEGPDYLNAWPSMQKLQSDLHLRMETTMAALHELQAREHVALITRRGRGQHTIISLRFKEDFADDAELQPNGEGAPAQEIYDGAPVEIDAADTQGSGADCIVPPADGAAVPLRRPGSRPPTEPTETDWEAERIERKEREEFYKYLAENEARGPMPDLGEYDASAYNDDYPGPD